MFIKHPLIKPDTIEERDYQVNIAKACIERSTLVVLPTGMGKTICALMVIVDRLEKFPDKKILFMAPTKPLVEQHKAFVDEFLLVDPDKTAIFTGEVSPKKRTVQWEENQVIVSTPQVIENDLLSDRIKLDDVSLIIFDETHRAVGNYAYVFVAEKYDEQAKNRLVMGITASPGNEARKIMEVCDNLNITSIEIRSEFDPDVMPYIHEIQVQWMRVDIPDKVKVIIKKLRNILEEKCKALYKFGLIRRVRNVSTTELLEAQRRIQARMATGKKQPHSLFFAATVQAAAIKINHAIELAETQGPSALRNYLGRLEAEANSKGSSRAARTLLKDKDLQRVIKLADNIEFEHPKIKAVAKVVKEQISVKEDSKIILFTHYRDTSELMVRELSKIRGLKPVRFVGQASHGDDRGLTQKQQVALIEKFKGGEYNILVATSVAEEGLDIPATDLVVFYEPIPSEIRTIQRRGRTGRKRPGKVVIMITRQSRDEAYYWSSRSKEKKMKSELEKLKMKLSEKFTIGKPRQVSEIFPTTKIGAPQEPEIRIEVPSKIGNPTKVSDPEINSDEETIEEFIPDDAEPISNEIIQNQAPNPTGSEVPSKTVRENIDPPTTNRTSDTNMLPLPSPFGIVKSAEGQTKLGDFQARPQITTTPDNQAKEQKLKVIVDTREFNSTVVRELVKRELVVEPKQLPVGDYVISERICVERKLVNDFLQSLIDGRLFAQLKRIKSEYQLPILILEGEGLFTSRKIYSSAIYGALTSIIADFNIPIISTANAMESAEMIRALASREQLENDRVPSIRGEKHAMPIHERQQFIIESLPSVSGRLAQRLLEHFGSVKDILMADVEALMQVKGVGKKTAQEIKETIEGEYGR